MTKTTEGTNGRLHSLLIADCGTSHTRVALIDVVGSSYRLVAHAMAPTTAAAPWGDIMLGLRAAIKQVEAITGRPLLTDRGRLIQPVKDNGAGVDLFTVVASAAPALQVWLVGLADDISLASGRRALRQSYTEEVGVFGLGNGRSATEQLNNFMAAAPDFVLVVGGVEGAANDQLLHLLEQVALGADLLTKSQRVRVIYAGNHAARDQVRQLVGHSSSLQMAENVRPTLTSETLADTTHLLGELYTDLKLYRLGGLQDLLEWAGSSPPRLTANALATMLHYFAHLYDGHIMGIDLGSQHVTLLSATSRQTRLRIDSQLGLGRPIHHILDKVPCSAIAQWVPDALGEADIKNFVYNKSLQPHTLPQTAQELALEQAVAREILRHTAQAAMVDWGWAEAPPPLHMLLVCGGIFTNQAHPGQLLLLLLDALPLTGIFAVAIDEHGLLPGLGALAHHEPVAVVQTLEAGILNDVGWVIIPAGVAQPGEKILDLVVQTEPKQRFEVEVTFGQLEILPLAVGQQATLTLKPKPGIDVGFGRGRSKKLAIHGGSLGLVIDARGRPLVLPAETEARTAQLQAWRQDMGVPM